jgi:hypothetical protein
MDQEVILWLNKKLQKNHQQTKRKLKNKKRQSNSGKEARNCASFSLSGVNLKL